MPPGKKPCTCADCRAAGTYIDEHGRELPGQVLEVRLVRHHAQVQRLRSPQESSNIAPPSAAIFLATMSDAPQLPFEQSVATRPRDDDFDDIDMVPSLDEDKMDIDEDAAVDDPQEPVGSSPGHLTYDSTSPKERLREIGEIQSAVSRKEARFRHPILKFTRNQADAIILDTSHPSTARFIEYRTEDLPKLYARTEQLLPIGDKSLDRQRDALLSNIEQYLHNAIRVEHVALREEQLKDCATEMKTVTDEPNIIIADDLFIPRTSMSMEPFITLALIIAVVLHTLASVARPESAFLLAGLKALLFGAFTWCNAPAGVMSQAQRLLLNCIPYDIRTALRILRLEPEIVRYVCCSQCFALYPPNPDPLQADNAYPHTCTALKADKTLCGTRLVVKKTLSPLRKHDAPRTVYRPLCVFPYRTLASWLKVFLSRPDIERLLEKSWTSKSKTPSSPWTDIMDAPAIREFRGPDGKILFSVQTNGSLHLVFSLFVDWFNPYGNKKAGKSHSIGAIYMACSNLPIQVRYSPENIYLAGIIPGPREPRLEQLNHLLRPLVDELQTFWSRGLYISRTALRWMGRLIRVAMIPLVCDLPALRKAAGFAGHSSKHVCSLCPIQKSDIRNIDRATWPKRRTWAEHLKIATDWRDADSAQRKEIFEKHGLRWSELLRLPYWDPTRFAVIDSMHNIFLGELRHHCMSVWGIDIKDKEPGTKKAVPHTPDEQRRNIDKGVQALKAKSRTALAKLRKGYVVSLARLNNVEPAGQELTKASYISALLDWAKTADLQSMRVPTILDYDVVDFHLAEDDANDISKFEVLTFEILQSIRNDIAATHLPSWLQKPPANFGSPSHGKLKADQWRTVCTVNMVITLVRLWGCSKASWREKKLLDNFLHLVAAADLATRRSMSYSRAAAFDRHMHEYLRGLLDIFDHNLVPNHHLSLHLYECLVLFGPVHGWWAFPFERYNGLLQQINTNNQTADMPLTFMRYFYIAGNIRRLMENLEWPQDPEYQQMVNSFERAFAETVRGTFEDHSTMFHANSPTHEYDEGKEHTLPLPIYNDFLRLINLTSEDKFTSAYNNQPSLESLPILHPAAQELSSICRDKITFSTKTTACRDSFVIFKDRDMNYAKHAGQIAHIFLHPRLKNGGIAVEPFLLIEAYTPLSEADQAKDLYSAYPDLQTKLYYNKPQKKIRVVPLDAVVSHFAAYVYTPDGIDQECIVARDLDRA